MFVEVDERRLVWFIKSIINSNYVDLPSLSDNDCNQICKLLTVNYEY